MHTLGDTKDLLCTCTQAKFSLKYNIGNRRSSVKLLVLAFQSLTDLVEPSFRREDGNVPVKSCARPSRHFSHVCAIVPPPIRTVFVQCQRCGTLMRMRTNCREKVGLRDLKWRRGDFLSVIA